MSVLAEERWELLAMGLADGLSQDKAAVGAGYKPNNARVTASKTLKRHPEIMQRVEEIKNDRSKIYELNRIMPVAKAAHELGINKKVIMEQLFDNALIAKAAIPVTKNGENIGIYQSNISASNQAFMLLGKELGMFTDRQDVTVNTRQGMTDDQLRAFVVSKYKRLGLDLDARLEEPETIEPLES
jgi:hypothetical protein